MGAEIFSGTDFKRLLKHDIKRDIRLVYEHSKISVVIIRINQNLKDHAKYLVDYMRDCDAIFICDEFVILLLPDTGREGALYMMDLVYESLGQKSAHLVVTYPEDGKNEDEIITSIMVKGRSILEVDLMPMFTKCGVSV